MSEHPLKLTLSAVLLAGGLSQRMGTDKAKLLFDGEPLWSRQLRVLRELNPEQIFISGRTAPEWCPPGVEVVLDMEPSRGPLSGLAAALNSCRTSHLLALAVDVPRVTADHLRKLWSLVEPDRGVLPENDVGCEPLCAIYPAGERIVSLARETLASGDVALRAFARRLIDEGRMRACVSLAPAIFLNLNTPDDLRKI